MKKKTGTRDVQMHCVAFFSQQKQKDRTETKHPHGCFLCNQLNVGFGDFNGSICNRRVQKKKKKKECCSVLETDHFI